MANGERRMRLFSSVYFGAGGGRVVVMVHGICLLRYSSDSSVVGGFGFSSFLFLFIDWVDSIYASDSLGLSPSRICFSHLKCKGVRVIS